MKTVLSSTYNPTFTPGGAGAGTLNFSTAVTNVGFSFQRLLAVLDLTTNTIIFAAGSAGGIWNSGTSVLTLTNSTSSCSSGDLLEVIWDDPKASVIIDAPNPSVPMGWPSVFNIITAATTNATSVKASAGTLGGYVITEGSATSSGPIYLKLYDKASPPTVGTDTPKIIIGMGNGVGYGGSLQASVIPSAGIKFTNGIAIAATLYPAISDTTAVTAGFAITLIYA